jgi:hypothetical protein
MEVIMASQFKLATGAIMLGEIQEFGSFTFAAQRYICRSLDVSYVPDWSVEEWADTAREADDMRTQMQVYALLPGIREWMPLEKADLNAEAFLFPLITVTAFDLSCRCLDSFSAYRFLYERLLGPMVRPWLSSAFAAAAALPHFSADERSALLASAAAEVTDQWSPDEPSFYPQWVGILEAIAA